jgi:hypothetical protein
MFGKEDFDTFKLRLFLQESQNVGQKHFLFLPFPLINKEAGLGVYDGQNLVRDLPILSKCVGCQEKVFLNGFELDLFNDWRSSQELLQLLLCGRSFCLKVFFLLVRRRVLIVDLKVLDLFGRFLGF